MDMLDLDTTWYSAREASEILGVHHQTVQRWVKRGQLPAVLLPGRLGYRISAEALEQFMRRRQVGTPVAIPGNGGAER